MRLKTVTGRPLHDRAHGQDERPLNCGTRRCCLISTNASMLSHSRCAALSRSATPRPTPAAWRRNCETGRAGTMRQSAETVRPYIGVGGWHARNACDVGVMARLFDGREVAHGPRTYADRAVRQRRVGIRGGRECHGCTAFYDASCPADRRKMRKCASMGPAAPLLFQSVYPV